MRERVLRFWRAPLLVAAAISGMMAPGVWAQEPAKTPPRPATSDRTALETPPALPMPGRTGIPEIVNSPPTLLGDEVREIDLNTALRLAGVQNPDLNFARQRVVESEALKQLAAAQFLPTINLGTNYDSHTGVLQQSNGNILSVQRSALYVGAGANAVAAGTVNIPGVFLNGNVAESIFGFLVARQFVRQQAFNSVAVRNQVFLRVALTYSELVRAEGLRAVAFQARDESREVARLTSAYAATGEGKPSDANRAATENAFREAELQAAEGKVLVASAELCRVLNLDPSIRLHPTDANVVPLPIVPNPMPLSELIAVGLLRRPELAERRAAIRGALLALEGTKVLPFSPTILVGFSAGGFGGGSNLVKPVFGGFGGRTDLDAVGYWTIRNMGVGNLALIRTADARLKATRYQEIAVLNLVRGEVAEAYARSHARYAQIGSTEAAVRSGLQGFQQDYQRILERDIKTTLPIELLDNFRLLARSRREYLDAIVDYNRAQFELFVAMGQPPADALAHPAPTSGIAPSGIPGPNSIQPTPNGPAIPNNLGDNADKPANAPASARNDAANTTTDRR